MKFSIKRTETIRFRAIKRETMRSFHLIRICATWKSDLRTSIRYCVRTGLFQETWLSHTISRLLYADRWRVNFKFCTFWSICTANRIFELRLRRTNRFRKSIRYDEYVCFFRNLYFFAEKIISRQENKFHKINYWERYCNGMIEERFFLHRNCTILLKYLKL